MSKAGFFKHFFSGIKNALVPPPAKVDLGKFWTKQTGINWDVHMLKRRSNQVPRVLYFYNKYKAAEEASKSAPSLTRRRMLKIEARVYRFLFLKL